MSPHRGLGRPSARRGYCSHRNMVLGALTLLTLVYVNTTMAQRRTVAPPAALTPPAAPTPPLPPASRGEKARGEEDEAMRFLGDFPGCYAAIKASHARGREARAAAQSGAFPTCPRVDEFEFPWPLRPVWRIASNPDPPQYPVCGWVPLDGRYPMRGMDSGRNAPHTRVISFFTHLNLTVLLKGGGALGAVRHGGPIPQDRDLDLVLPVWLNLDRGQSPCPQAGDEAAEAGPQGRGGFLCGLDRDSWVGEVQRFLTPHLERAGMHARETEYGGLRLMGGGITPVDLVVSIWDGWVIPEKQGGGVCRCPWGGVDALCVENEHEHMRHEYGPGYMTPDRASANA